MKERGMIFNGEMVRALLDGRKTQTRRIVKQQPDEDGLAKITDGPWVDTSERTYSCPFGAVGDRIWVRETSGLQVRRDALGDTGEFRVYRASAPDAVRYTTAEGKDVPVKWIPSIHMPRWASRILLEITDVRVERLSDLSEEDALCEGIDREKLEESQDNYDCIADHNMTGRPTATGAFKCLWESIYGADSWQVNPWVWVIEFKRIEGGAHATD